MTAKPLLTILVMEPILGWEDTILELPLDVRISTTHSFQSTITEFPVEAGALISDHVHLRPDALTIEGFVSDSPVNVIPTAPPMLKGDLGQREDYSRSQDAFDVLQEIRRQKKPLTVIDRFLTYEDMMIESLEIPQSRDRSTGLWFTMTLKKIQTVETLAASLPPDVVAALKRKSAKAQYEKIKKMVGKHVADLTKKLDEQLASQAEQGAQAVKKTTTDKPWERFGKTEAEWSAIPWDR